MAEPVRADHLQLCWLGHSPGRRADGLTTYSEQVVGGLTARGSSVYFHHSSTDGPETFAKVAEEILWPSLRFKTVALAHPSFRRRMGRWFESHRPQVTHCSVSFTLDDGWVARTASAAGSATVATFHLPFGQPGTGRALVMRELHRFWARRLRSYQRVIVFSEDHLDRLVQVGFVRERLIVVPNAVDTDVFAPGPGHLRQSRLPQADLVVGFAGRLDPEKGIRELLAGFRAADLGKGARLLIAGSGSLEHQVRTAASEDPRVVYLGQLRELPTRVDFWRSVDLFCLPSSAEGLSLAMLEAMACGCAVAVTPAGGLQVMAGAGLELDPLRLRDSISDQLREVAHAPERARLKGLAARSAAVRHHGLKEMLDRLLSIYQDARAQLASEGESEQ